MSDKIAYLVPISLVINPIAMPDTGLVILIPASINANVPAQTVAIDDEPFDSKISETTRIVYGFASSAGNTRFNERIAKLPWPISLRPAPLFGRTSPVEKPGKL